MYTTDSSSDSASHTHSGPCPGSVPYGAAGWPVAGGMANGVVRLALAKSR